MSIPAHDPETMPPPPPHPQPHLLPLQPHQTAPPPDLVEGLVDGLVVVGLHGAQVWPDEVQVAHAAEEADAAGVVQARRQHQQQVAQ